MVADREIRINGGSPMSVGVVLSYLAESLAPGSFYTFQVRDLSMLGNYSAWSNTASAITPIPVIKSVTFLGDRLLFLGEPVVFTT